MYAEVIAQDKPVFHYLPSDGPMYACPGPCKRPVWSSKRGRCYCGQVLIPVKGASA